MNERVGSNFNSPKRPLPTQNTHTKHTHKTHLVGDGFGVRGRETRRLQGAFALLLAAGEAVERGLVALLLLRGVEGLEAVQLALRLRLPKI